MLVRLLPVLLVIFLFGCTESTRTTQGNQEEDSRASTLQTSGNPSLVFFLDPYGRPCQIQDEILRGMHDEFRGVVELRYLQTNIPAHLDFFYSFGIRGLPALLLADASGKEIRRLPPGVRSPEEIRRLLQAVSN
jgi:thioredoxin 1